jgi:hypothetical protein
MRRKVSSPDLFAKADVIETILSFGIIVMSINRSLDKLCMR